MKIASMSMAGPISALILSTSIVGAGYMYYLNARGAVKASAVQGCLEVSQSYKKTLGKNDTTQTQYELHEVSFNKDMYSSCIQQKGF